MTVYVTPSRVKGEISVKRESSGLPELPGSAGGGTYITLWTVALGGKLFWRVFLPEAGHLAAAQKHAEKAAAEGRGVEDYSDFLNLARTFFITSS